MNKLKTIVATTISTALLYTAGAAMAGHVVSQRVYHPNPRTKIVNQKVCGHRGCVNIHKKIRHRRNGMKKVITQRCKHGYCHRHVVVRG